MLGKVDHSYSFEILEHTADVGLVARGRDQAEAFCAAAYGLASLMADLSRAEPLEERQVEVEAEDAEGLLVAWLSELVYLFDAEGFLPCRFDVQQIDRHSLRAHVDGDHFDPMKHPPNATVKAVTYHQLRVQYKAAGCEVQVIFDI